MNNDQSSVDNMSVDSESDEEGAGFGSDDRERYIGVQHGHVGNGRSREVTSEKPHSSPQARRRTEGVGDDLDQGHMREPANPGRDSSRGSVQGWLQADSVKRQVDTDQASGILSDEESRRQKPSTASRKRPRRDAAAAREQGRQILHVSNSVARNIGEGGFSRSFT